MWPNILQRPMKVPECSGCSTFSISVDRRPIKLGVTLNPRGGGEGTWTPQACLTKPPVTALGPPSAVFGATALGNAVSKVPRALPKHTALGPPACRVVLGHGFGLHRFGPSEIIFVFGCSFGPTWVLRLGPAYLLVRTNHGRTH